MLTVTIIAVGKIKERWIDDGILEYQKRLKGYCQFSVVEVPEHKLPLKPSQGEIQAGLEKEGEGILGKIPNRSKVIALCIEGKTLSSEGLAKQLEDYSSQSSSVVIIIGSSHGLDPKVKLAADLQLSVSLMTFPHQLARLILIEQLYRGFSINGGSKYHK